MISTTSTKGLCTRDKKGVRQHSYHPNVDGEGRVWNPCQRCGNLPVKIRKNAQKK